MNPETSVESIIQYSGEKYPEHKWMEKHSEVNETCEIVYKYSTL